MRKQLTDSVMVLCLSKPLLMILFYKICTDSPASRTMITSPQLLAKLIN